MWSRCAGPYWPGRHAGGKKHLEKSAKNDWPVSWPHRGEKIIQTLERRWVRLYVRAWLLKSPRRIARLVRRLGVLFDAGCCDLDPGRFWRSGSYFTHPARAKALVLVFLPQHGLDWIVLGRRAAGLLGARKGLALDWAGKDRGSAIWVIVKTMACDLKTGRNREFRLNPDDLAALRSLAPGRKASGRRRLR